MALNNRDRVGKAFEFLSEGLEDPVSDVMTRVFRKGMARRCAR